MAAEHRRAVRAFDAPTRAEAEVMAAPVIAAFDEQGWTEEERLWIPGDRRVGLGESLLLGEQSQQLLEAEGTLRIAWIAESELSQEPMAQPAARAPDTWEQLGGTRYRRVVPREVIGLVVFAIGAIVLLAWYNSSRDSMGGGEVFDQLDPPSFSGYPPAADGSCPDGYALEANGRERICWPDAYFQFFEQTPSPN